MGHFNVFELEQEASNNCRRKKGKKLIISATIIRGNTVSIEQPFKPFGTILPPTP